MVSICFGCYYFFFFFVYDLIECTSTYCRIKWGVGGEIPIVIINSDCTNVGVTGVVVVFKVLMVIHSIVAVDGD